MKSIILLIALLTSISTFAVDKKEVNLDQVFWGKWSIYNPKLSCSENYDFQKPDSFHYQENKKILDGLFALLRKDGEDLDLLILNIQNDNGLQGCGTDTVNYQGKKSSFFLKWVTVHSAEICMDRFGTQCTGLYLTKKLN